MNSDLADVMTESMTQSWFQAGKQIENYFRSAIVQRPQNEGYRAGTYILSL